MKIYNFTFITFLKEMSTNLDLKYFVVFVANNDVFTFFVCWKKPSEKKEILKV